MSNLFIIVLLLIVGLITFFIGRWYGISKGSQTLSQELKTKEQELTDLKKQVSQHFDETARLFSNVTEEYKMLYQHLAKSASTLSDHKFELALKNDSPELPGLTNIATAQDNDKIIDSEAKEISDYDAGPQQPRDYADNDIDDDYVPQYTATEENHIAVPDITAVSNKNGNLTTESESEAPLEEPKDDPSINDDKAVNK